MPRKVEHKWGYVPEHIGYQPAQIDPDNHIYSLEFIKQLSEEYDFPIPSKKSELISFRSSFDYAAREYLAWRDNQQNEVKPKHVKAAFEELKKHNQRLIYALENFDNKTGQKLSLLTHNKMQAILRAVSYEKNYPDSSFELGNELVPLKEKLFDIGAIHPVEQDGGSYNISFVSLRDVPQHLKFLDIFLDEALADIPHDKGGRPAHIALRRWMHLMHKMWLGELGKDTFSYDDERGDDFSQYDFVASDGKQVIITSEAGRFLRDVLAHVDKGAVFAISTLFKEPEDVRYCLSKEWRDQVISERGPLK